MQHSSWNRAASPRRQCCRRCAEFRHHQSGGRRYERVLNCVPGVCTRAVHMCEVCVSLFSRWPGMMDIALLTANANQLRFLFAYNRQHETFVYSLSLIVASLIMQMLVGIGLLIKVRFVVVNEVLRRLIMCVAGDYSVHPVRKKTPIHHTLNTIRHTTSANGKTTSVRKKWTR